ncbi:substrate-binding domain-containing protein [Nocardioides astragali]|uniref:Substrate-binding domain-containing protein n=1 Tax=Nocardioides astragali TaxID=1776736 RepID=A0ABW2MZP9_9ACTN|nr:substrate-binding domain-containing protein [Nocardioides astragali]
MADSLVSLGVLHAFADLGTRCPDAVSLIGFDDADWAEAVSPLHHLRRARLGRPGQQLTRTQKRRAVGGEPRGSSGLDG